MKPPSTTSEQARAIHRDLAVQRREAASGPPAVLSLAEQRAMAERVGDSTTEPSGVTYDDVDAGGVPAQWVTPDGAVTGRVLLYFHGGGYGFCSVRSHRKLVGHLARAAGVAPSASTTGWPRSTRIPRRWPMR